MRNVVAMRSARCTYPYSGKLESKPCLGKVLRNRLLSNGFKSIANKLAIYYFNSISEYGKSEWQMEGNLCTYRWFVGLSTRYGNNKQLLVQVDIFSMKLF